MKKCAKCKETKNLNQYYRQKKSPDGYQYWCIDCARTRAREWRRANHEKWFPYKYGITFEQRNQIIADQDFKCPICLRPFTPSVFPCVDHDKETGEIRGILCSADNTAIGSMQHDPDRLLRAADYLSR